MRRVIRTLAGAALAALAAAACASPGIPPGGPEDESPPRLLHVSPDTNATGVRPRAVVFTFDEVVSETPRAGGSATGGSGGSALAGLVIVSPRTGVPSVDWQRSRLAVTQRGGFSRPNTTYTVTLLPGLQDLRNNVRDTAIVLTFSTGPTIARGRVGGAVFDWAAGRPAARALVEAIAPDSTTFVTIADSVGRFTIGQLTPGTYVVRAVIDFNNNRGFDPREAFDTVRVDSARVARADTTGLELYAFVHDTIGTRLQTVTQRDSVTLRLAFDKPILPGQPLDAARFIVQGADSSAVPVATVMPATLFDSLETRRTRAAADSAARARRDSTRPPTAAGPAPLARRDSAARADSLRRRRGAAEPPKPSRPTPTVDVVVQLARPLPPGATFRVTARDIRGLAGPPRTSSRTFTTPKATAAPPRPDSTRRPPPAGPPGSAPPTPSPTRPPARPDSTPAAPRRPGR